MIIKDNFCVLATILNQDSRTEFNSSKSRHANKKPSESDSSDNPLSSSSKLIFKEAFTLKTIQTMKLKAPITSLYLTRDDSNLLVSLRDGKLIVITGERVMKK